MTRSMAGAACGPYWVMAEPMRCLAVPRSMMGPVRSIERAQECLHLRDEITTAVRPSRYGRLNPGLKDRLRFFRFLQSDQCTAERQVRGDVERIELDGDAQVFHGFFQATAFLQELIAETVPA